MENLERSNMVAPDKVFDNPEVQLRWAVTVQHIVWGLIGIAVLTIVGVFGLAIFNSQMPDTVVILATTAITGCISGLVGFIAGRSTQNV